MKFLLPLFLSLALLGCESKDRESISKEGGKALEHAGNAAATAWNSVAKKVSEITPDSTQEAMDSARQAAEDAQKKLGQIPNPSPEIMAQIESAKAAIGKLDAAAKVQEMQQRLGKMVEDAKAQADNAGKSIDEVKADLYNGSREFNKLAVDVETARRHYEETYGKGSQK